MLLTERERESSMLERIVLGAALLYAFSFFNDMHKLWQIIKFDGVLKDFMANRRTCVFLIVNHTYTGNNGISYSLCPVRPTLNSAQLGSSHLEDNLDNDNNVLCCR